MASNIDITYTLTEDEIYKSLQKSGIYKTSGKRVIIENLLLLACGGFFVYSCFIELSAFNVIMAAISFGLMALITFVPAHDMRKQAKMGAGKETKMRITPQKLSMEDNEKKWEIKLDGTTKYKILDNLILLITEKRGLVVLPVRAFPKDKTSEIQSRIFSGTIEAK